MKKLFLLLLLSILTLGARAMSFEEAQRHALFLSDKMAYELGLTARQYEEVYQINLDYLLFVEPGSVYGNWWRSRNAELRRILTSVQYAEYERTYHFYRPVHWRDGAWHYGVYGYYTDRTVFYRERPRIYHSYRGGRYFGPRPGVAPRPAPRPRPGVAPRPAPRPRPGVAPRPAPRPRPGVAPRPAPGPRPNGLRDRGPAPRPNAVRPNSARPNTTRPSGTRPSGARQGTAPSRSNNLRQGPSNNRSNTRGGTTDRPRRDFRR